MVWYLAWNSLNLMDFDFLCYMWLDFSLHGVAFSAENLIFASTGIDPWQVLCAFYFLELLFIDCLFSKI